MTRQAKIYYQDQLAGYLIEGDGWYVFKYEKQGHMPKTEHKKSDSFGVAF